MIRFTIASQYSKALAKLSASEEKMKKHLADLERVIEVFKTNPKVRELLLDPHLLTEDKKKVITKLFEGKVEKTTLHFLFILVEKGRLTYLPEVGLSYRRLVDKATGMVSAHLTTAVSLDEPLREKVRMRLEKMFNKKVDMQSAVDPSIIGGMIVMVGNQLVDDSVKQRLAKLKENLLAAKV